jgi:hypothetical protein
VQGEGGGEEKDAGGDEKEGAGAPSQDKGNKRNISTLMLKGSSVKIKNLLKVLLFGQWTMDRLGKWIHRCIFLKF